MPDRGIGIIGLGVISRFYAAAIAATPGWRLAGVCDVDDAALAPYRNRVPCHRNYRDLLADPAVSAVAVTVPNDRHAEVCRAALAAGRAVCVEKPLATTVLAAEELDCVARASGLVLFTAFHRHYNAQLAALRRRITGRPPVRRVIVRYQERIEDHLGSDDWYLDPGRCGGGCLADNGPNAFDMARLVAGPLRVTGARIGWDGGAVDRSATVDLVGSGGAEVRVELDWSFPGERKEIEVELADGAGHRANMLHGHPEFKGSLWHEYVGVLTDFGSRRPDAPNLGLASARLVRDAYAAERAARAAR